MNGLIEISLKWKEKAIQILKEKRLVETLSKFGSAGKVYALQYLSKKANLEKLIEAIERVLV